MRFRYTAPPPSFLLAHFNWLYVHFRTNNFFISNSNPAVPTKLLTHMSSIFLNRGLHEVNHQWLRRLWHIFVHNVGHNSKWLINRWQRRILSHQDLPLVEFPHSFFWKPQADFINLILSNISVFVGLLWLQYLSVDWKMSVFYDDFFVPVFDKLSLFCRYLSLEILARWFHKNRFEILLLWERIYAQNSFVEIYLAFWCWVVYLTL